MSVRVVYDAKPVALGVLFESVGRIPLDWWLVRRRNHHLRQHQCRIFGFHYFEAGLPDGQLVVEVFGDGFKGFSDLSFANGGHARFYDENGIVGIYAEQ